MAEAIRISRAKISEKVDCNSVPTLLRFPPQRICLLGSQIRGWEFLQKTQVFFLSPPRRKTIQESFWQSRKADETHSRDLKGQNSSHKGETENRTTDWTSFPLETFAEFRNYRNNTLSKDCIAKWSIWKFCD